MGKAKRFRRCASSSSQKVVLSNEDLLTLILLHVPWTKLISLKCVSRQWLSLITTFHFSNLLPPLRASGLFIQAPHDTFIDVSSPNEVYFLSLDDPNKASPFKTRVFENEHDDHENIRILQSCNGLLLCSNVPGTRFYVYNPSTNQLATPKQPLGTWDTFRYVGLSFDPSKSLNYKVIGLVSRPRSQALDERDFYIFSSETKAWKSSVQSFTSDPGMYFNDGVYWNGCMHWLSTLHRDLEPDSSVSVCLYFNVDEERVGTFPGPPIGEFEEGSLYFGESEGHLHVIEACPMVSSLSVYEMKSDYSMWFVKYQIDLDPIFRAFPEIKDITSFEYQFYYAVKVFSLIRRENFHEDSFLVLEIPGKVIRYNLMDRSFKLIWDFGVDLDIDPHINDDLLFDFQVCPYIKTLSCV
ncbi:F-box domain containing protein [Heracleum sosnowskyi]|uniref:F-box domain containing protein n=1 Tax=Heracleum sosnowskyi TaxID=360622 RepID=A0AAD8HAI6_9APIA|nr:F-box domain containing protein [Heracleum sosnowskyi]